MTIPPFGSILLLLLNGVGLVGYKLGSCRVGVDIYGYRNLSARFVFVVWQYKPSCSEIGSWVGEWRIDVEDRVVVAAGTLDSHLNEDTSAVVDLDIFDWLEEEGEDNCLQVTIDERNSLKRKKRDIITSQYHLLLLFIFFCSALLWLFCFLSFLSFVQCTKTEIVVTRTLAFLLKSYTVKVESRELIR